MASDPGKKQIPPRTLTREELEQRKLALREERRLSKDAAKDATRPPPKGAVKGTAKPLNGPRTSLKSGDAARTPPQRSPPSRSISPPPTNTPPLSPTKEADLLKRLPVQALDADAVDITADDLDTGWDSGQQEDIERYIRVLYEDKMLADVVNKGTNLQGYTAEREKELAAKEAASVQDYVDNIEEYAKLYDEITASEEILDSITSVMKQFKDHLGSITGDIRALQQRSTEITNQMQNMDQARLHISPVLHKLEGISPEWLREVETRQYEAPDGANKQERQRKVEEEFLRGVRDVDKLINFIKEDPHLQHSLVQQDLYPSLMATAQKLCTRVNSFLLSKLDSLKEPTNIRIQQQSIAHRCAFAFRFLRQHSQSLSDHMLDEYKSMMNKAYHRILRRQQQQAKAGVKLAKPDLVVPKDLFDAKKGVETGEASRKLRDMLSKRPDILTRDRVQIPFADRIRTLAAIVPDGDQLVLDPSILVGQPKSIIEEYLQINTALVNAALQEASFVAEFFSLPSSQREAVLSDIFSKGIGFVKERSTELLMQAQGDVVTILFFLRMTESLFNFLLPQKDDLASSFSGPDQLVTSRSVAVPNACGSGIAQRSASRQFRPPGILVGHFKESQAILWGMYRDAFADHLHSIQAANHIQFAPYARFDPEAKSVGEILRSHPHLSQTLCLHSTTKRYTDLAGDVHILNTLPVRGSRISGAPQGSKIFSDTIVADLAAMRTEMHKLLVALSRRQPTATLMSIFIINNLATVLETFRERGVSSTVSDDIVELEDSLCQHINLFVIQEVSSSHFGAVFEFSEKAKLLQPAQTEEEFEANRRVISCDELLALVNTFYTSWREIIASLNDTISTYFQKLQASQLVLRAMFTKVLEANEHLRTAAHMLWASPPCRAKLVSKEIIKHEITTRYVMSL